MPQLQRHNTNRFSYSGDPPPSCKKKKNLIVSEHPRNGCMQPRGSSKWSGVRRAVTCSLTLGRSFYSRVSCFGDRKMLRTPCSGSM